MATSVSKSTMDGFHKVVYGELEDAVPEFAEIQESVKFEFRQKTGKSYNFPVVLSRSHGVTIASGGGAFALNEAESLVTDEASVTSAQLVVREKIGYDVVTSAGSSEQAFGDAMDPIIASLKQTSHFYVEMFLLYGGSPAGIGEIQGRYTDSGTTQVFQLKKESWAPGLWMQMQNAYIDVWDDDLDPKRNAAGTIKVTSIDPDERTITCVGTEAEMDTIVAGDFIFPRGAYSGSAHVWPSGIDAICRNTGVMFGIDAALHALWRASGYAVGAAALTATKLQNASLKGVTRGGLAEDTTARISVFSWSDIMNDLSALKRFADETKNEMSVGTRHIKLHSFSGKTMTLKPHAMVKAGEFFVGPDRTLKRIGSTDVTMRLDVTGNGEGFYQELKDNAGFEVRTFSDQAAISTRPALWVRGSGIINNSLGNAVTET